MRVVRIVVVVIIVKLINSMFLSFEFLDDLFFSLLLSKKKSVFDDEKKNLSLMSKIVQNKRKKWLLRQFLFSSTFFLIIHCLIMKIWLFSQLMHMIFVFDIEHFFVLWSNFAQKSHLMIEWHWIFVWSYVQQLKHCLTEALRYLLSHACVFSLHMMFFLMISFVCFEIVNSSIRLVCLFFSDFLSHSIHLMSLKFLKCFNLTEFSAVNVSMMRVILFVFFICMLFIHTECIKISKIFMYTFALMSNIWIHLMNLLKYVLFSFLRIEMITSSLSICRMIIALNIHELFDIFELFENF